MSEAVSYFYFKTFFFGFGIILFVKACFGVFFCSEGFLQVFEEGFWSRFGELLSNASSPERQKLGVLGRLWWGHLAVGQNLTLGFQDH